MNQVDEFGNTALSESRVVEVAFAEGVLSPLNPIHPEP